MASSVGSPMASSAQLFEQLMSGTDQAVASLQKRTERTTDLADQLAEVQDQLEQAAQIRDAKEREVRLKILGANFNQLRQDAAAEEKDLAEAVVGLSSILGEMGVEYAQLGSQSPAEQQLIERAEARLARSEQERVQAQGKWLFKAAAIAKADQEIAAAKQGIEYAKSEAIRLARKRLLAANIEQSLQDFMLKVEKTIQIMSDRMNQINEQVQKVTVREAEALKAKEAAAAAMEKFDQELNEAEAELHSEEDKLSSLANGTQEYVKQEQTISGLRMRVEELRGRRNTALTLFQSKEKFAEELGIHKRTQVKLRDNQAMWIIALRSDTEERVVTFRSRLEAMKAMSDQGVAEQLDTLGAAADQKNAVYMAQAGQASDDMRLKKLELHPERFSAMANISAAQAEAIQKVRMREGKLIQEFQEKYHLDVSRSSFFHYQPPA